MSDAPGLRIRRIGERLGRLGLGTAPLGNLYSVVADDDADATIATAVRLGVRYIDTAPLYGVGPAERRVGEALRSIGRSECALSTKTGYVLGEAGSHGRPARSFTREATLRSVEASLGRLGVSSLEALLIHDPDDHLDEALAQCLPTLTELREQGVVRFLGVGMNQAAPLEWLVRRADIDLVLIAGRYTLLDRTAAGLLDLCDARDVAVVVGGVFNSGLLADPDRSPMFDYRPAGERVVAAARRLAHCCRAFDVPLPAAALQFPLRHRATATALVGCRSASEVQSAVAGSRLPIPEELWQAIDESLAADAGGFRA